MYEETRPHIACEFLIPKTHSSKCHFYEIKLGRTSNRLQILVTGHVHCYRTVCPVILQEWTREAKQNQIKCSWLITLWKLSKWMTKILCNMFQPLKRLHQTAVMFLLIELYVEKGGIYFLKFHCLLMAVGELSWVLAKYRQSESL